MWNVKISTRSGSTRDCTHLDLRRVLGGGNQKKLLSLARHLHTARAIRISLSLLLISDHIAQRCRRVRGTHGAHHALQWARDRRKRRRRSGAKAHYQFGGGWVTADFVSHNFPWSLFYKFWICEENNLRIGNAILLVIVLTFYLYFVLVTLLSTFL